MSHPNPIEALREIPETRVPAAFTSLPTEIHIQIASILPYPDALALKHTSIHFYSLVKTDLELKVDWVLERHKQGLAVPRRNCEFRTDETFCKGEVCNIMENRRWHLECKPGMAGCLVVEGSNCGGSSSFVFRLLRGNRLMISLTRKHMAIENQVFLFGLLLCLATLVWEMTLKQNWAK